MKKRTPLLILLASLICHHAYAVDLPVDTRIRILTYAPSDVYTVSTKYGYQTNIVFAQSEEILTVSVGDRSPWQIIPAHNRIFLRPLMDNVATNMTVITNQREYHFDINSVGKDQNTNIYAAHFRYPDAHNSIRDELEDVTPPMSESPEVALHSSSVPSTSIPTLDTQRTRTENHNYTYTGNDAIAPAQVFDDGVSTYILYAQMSSPPPRPMVTGSGGELVVANHSVDQNRIVMHTVASGFVLKNASGDVTVYNELLNPNR